MDTIKVEEFELNITLVDAGPVATGYATNTDDNCGSGNTGSDACTGVASKQPEPGWCPAPNHAGVPGFPRASCSPRLVRR